MKQGKAEKLRKLMQNVDENVHNLEKLKTYTTINTQLLQNLEQKTVQRNRAQERAAN